MTSLTDAMIGYIAPESSDETEPLRRQLPSPVQALFIRPATGSKFRDVRDAVSGAATSEQGTMLNPEAVGLTVTEHADADWIAVGIPTLTWDELETFVEGWNELPDDEAFLNELRGDEYWEAYRTTDGRWALLPQDRSDRLTVTLPMLVGYDRRIVFERVSLLQFQGGSPVPVAKTERASQCAMESTKQLPNAPYRGSCEQRGCLAGCAPILGRASDGAKVLLACNC